MLSLVHLKVLAAVARHGSVTEAAKQLHYSQPSVSHQVSGSCSGSAAVSG
jgi:DNA-binding transcriptional LysR family regulator